MFVQTNMFVYCSIFNKNHGRVSYFEIVLNVLELKFLHQKGSSLTGKWVELWVQNFTLTRPISNSQHNAGLLIYGLTRQTSLIGA